MCVRLCLCYFEYVFVFLGVSLGICENLNVLVCS